MGRLAIWSGEGIWLYCHGYKIIITKALEDLGNFSPHTEEWTVEGLRTKYFSSKLSSSMENLSSYSSNGTFQCSFKI